MKPATPLSAIAKPQEVKATSPGGMPAFEPTPEQRATVEAMAGYGIPHEDIALVVINPRTDEPIDPKTLRAHFRRELDTGHVKANASIAQTLFTAAKAGNITAAIWWTKARMRWSERVEHTGAEGEPIKLEVSHRDRAKALLKLVAQAKAEKAE